MIGPEFKNVLLIVAVAGVFLLFARDWTVRVIGVALMLPRLVAAPLTMGEILMFGSGVAAAVSRVVYGWSFGPIEVEEEVAREPDVADPDDVSEPAACVACRGLIPAGASACPQCGWTYTAP